MKDKAKCKNVMNMATLSDSLRVAHRLSHYLGPPKRIFLDLLKALKRPDFFLEQIFGQFVVQEKNFVPPLLGKKAQKWRYNMSSIT